MTSAAEVVKTSVRLADVVERYGVKLKRASSNSMVGKCPVHVEKEPSFRVYDDGHYHCYGCGFNGDVISFIETVENVDFRNAIKILIESFGADNSASEEYRQIRAKQKLVYEWYAEQVEALDNLIFGYQILCRKLKRDDDEENYWSALQELWLLEGDGDGFPALHGEVRQLGGQGEVLVALYDSYGPHSFLPPIKERMKSLAYSKLAIKALCAHYRKLTDWTKHGLILCITDHSNLECLPADGGKQLLQQTLASADKAYRAIDVIRNRTSKRSQSQTVNSRLYPRRSSSRRRDDTQSAA